MSKRNFEIKSKHLCCLTERLLGNYEC